MTDYYQHVKTTGALDVGSARDFSVLTIVETHDLMRTDPFPPHEPKNISREFWVIYQERFSGDYSDQIDTIVQKLRNYDEVTQAGPVHPDVPKTFICEINGVGLTLFSLLKKKIPATWHVIGTLLTGGDAVTKESGIYHLPKREIINSLTHTIDEGSLKIPEDLPTKDQLLSEAAGFIRSYSPTGREILNSDVESRHDDCVISLSYAIWYSLSRQEARAIVWPWP